MTAPIRIAVASSGLGHVARGIESWAADLAAALDRRGESVRLYKGGGQADLPHEQVIACWQRESPAVARLLRWLPRRGTWRLGLHSSYGIEQTTFALALLPRLRRDRIDVLHVQDPQVALIVQGAYRLGLVRTRVILAHGTEEALRFQRRITYLQHLAPWHLESAQAAGVWKPSWTAIPNFIDADQFHPGRSDCLRSELGIGPDELVILTVAAIKRQHKRIDFLLAEFAQLLELMTDRPVRLVVAGGKEADTDDLVRQGRDLLGDQVRFLVRFPRGRMPDLYRMANIFVLGSLKEMMPIALLEAMASGLPCVVSDHPVVSWMVGPGGEAIDMGRSGNLARVLADLSTDGPRRRARGEAARIRSTATFGADRVVTSILDYYQQVLDRPGRLAAESPPRTGAYQAK